MAAQKSTKKPDSMTVNLNNYDDRKGRLKSLGGSQSDNWNELVAKQTLQSLWLTHSDPEERQRQWAATAEALAGIGPQDELEGMLAAQLIAAHNAAMECYRRAMIAKQTFEGWRENLNQANKLSRTYTALLDALNRHRGKGQQKVTVEHVHVHEGGQAVVGTVEAAGDRRKADARSQKADGQSEVKQIAHAPQPVMAWNANREREPVPPFAERGMADTGQNLADQAPNEHRRPDAGRSVADPRALRRE
jgi:hypothetical protein